MCVCVCIDAEEAYEFVLKNVGHDIMAGQLWLDFIAFTKTRPVTDSRDTTERNMAVRRAYQRAVVMPTNAIDTLWKEYDVFEHSLNKELAVGLTTEYLPRKTMAAKVVRQRKKLRDIVMSHLPPLGLPRPIPRASDQQARDYQLFLAWQECIAYEKSNPAKLNPRDLKDTVMRFASFSLFVMHGSGSNII